MNRPWSDEEEILLIDLYVYSLSHANEEYESAVIVLSEALREKAISANRNISSTYRNPTGIKMKVHNIEYLATRGAKGLSGFSRKDRKFYMIFRADKAKFSERVVELKAKYKIDYTSPVSSIIHKDEEAKSALVLNPSDTNDVVDEALSENVESSEGVEAMMPNAPIKSDVSFVETYGELYKVDWEEYQDIKIDNVFSSPRVLHALQNSGIKDLGTLLHMTSEDISKIKNLGVKSVSEIAEELEKIFRAGERPEIFSTASGRIRDRQNDGETVSPKLEIIKAHRNEIVMGNFDFAYEEDVSTEEHLAIEKYRDAYEVLGPQLAFVCFSTPEKIVPVLTAFQEIAAIQEQRDLRRNQLLELLNEMPEERRIKPAVNYVRIFAGENSEKQKLLSYCIEPGISLSCLVEKIDLSQREIYIVASGFYSWCNFDIAENVERIITKVFKSDRTLEVVRMRSEKCTLEAVGSHFEVTRERIRQIEAKAGRALLSLFKRDDIFPKISAERNGETILPVLVLDEYFGQYTQEIVYLLKVESKYASYSYDELLDAFVLGDELPSEIIQDAIDQLPEYFPLKKFSAFVSHISEELNIPAFSVERALNEVYNLTGGTYHRTRLTRSAIYADVVRKYYPDGIWVYDATALQEFRQHLLDEYGVNVFDQSDHALASIIMRTCVLCGRGTYRIKESSYLSPDLLSRIHKYIKNSPNNIILANAVFQEFEDELSNYGVNNRYYLFGILHEIYDNEYIFRKGYIYKSGKASNIYTEIVRFVKKSTVPISKEEIYRHFPGITEIVIQIALNDDTILNYFGEYLYAGYLNISGEDRSYLGATLKHFLVDSKEHHCKDVFELISCERPEFLDRNWITTAFRLYSVLEYLYRNDYQFSRPYIALNGVSIGRAGERLKELIMSVDEISIADISEFSKDNHYGIYSMLDYINSYNKEYFFRDHDSIARIEVLGVNEIHAHEIEQLIIDEISETEIVANLACIHRFPKIAVPWNEWLVYSVLKRWSTLLDVNTSDAHLRFATPLVAPKGHLDTQKYGGMQDFSGISVVQADDLDDIDSLIADYVLDGDL